MGVKGWPRSREDAQGVDGASAGGAGGGTAVAEYVSGTRFVDPTDMDAGAGCNCCIFVCLSVRPSVRPSFIHVHALRLQPLYV